MEPANQRAPVTACPAGFKEVVLDTAWRKERDSLTQEQLFGISYKSAMGLEPQMITHIRENQTITPELAENIKLAYNYSDKNIASLRKLDGDHVILLELQAGSTLPSVLEGVNKLIDANPKATVVFVHSMDAEHIITVSAKNGCFPVKK